MNVSLLRASFESIVDRHPQVTSDFYEVLFARYPAVRSLFGRNSRSAQEKMLTQALVAVIDHLEDAAWFQETLMALGAKHVGYGVTDEMYDWVGECLLTALAHAAGPDWTAEVEAEWRGAYGAIAAAMLAGARSARAAA
jgi:hemoglobin-like flavoprotein